MTTRRAPSTPNTYRPLTEDWVRGTTLSAFDRRPGTFFGHDFHTTEDGTREDELWISAPGTGFTGAIYRFAFDSDTRTFGSAIRITNTIDPSDGDGFGGAVATAGDLAIVGQPGNDGGLGSAVVMRNQGGGYRRPSSSSPPSPVFQRWSGERSPAATPAWWTSSTAHGSTSSLSFR